MRHRDPRLFYMTMEVTVRRANVRTILPLDEDARPAVLQSCHPRGDSRYVITHYNNYFQNIYNLIFKLNNLDIKMCYIEILG